MPQVSTELLNSLGIALEMVVAVLTALLVAFWVGLAIWTLRDIRARTRDFFAWILATVLVLVAGPIGWLLYFLLRPRETLAEVYDRQLEEEALLRDVTARRACPTCQTVTEPDWLLCPHCRTALRQTCQQCGKPLELDWVACPYCTAPLAGNGSDGRAPVVKHPALWTPELEPENPSWAPEPEAESPTVWAPQPEVENRPLWSPQPAAGDRPLWPPEPKPDPLVTTRPLTGSDD